MNRVMYKILYLEDQEVGRFYDFIFNEKSWLVFISISGNEYINTFHLEHLPFSANVRKICVWSCKDVSSKSSMKIIEELELNLKKFSNNQMGFGDVFEIYQPNWETWGAGIPVEISSKISELMSDLP